MVFFHKTGLDFKDSQFLLEKFPFFLKSIMDDVIKQKQVEYIEHQLGIAEAVRIATIGKKKDYLSWWNAKKRSLWKIQKTDEEKEAEAIENWKKLHASQEQFLQNGKTKKKSFINKILGK